MPVSTETRIKRNMIGQKVSELEQLGITPNDLLDYSVRMKRKQEAQRMDTLFSSTISSYPTLHQTFWNKLKGLAGNTQLPISVDWTIPLEEAQDAIENDDSKAFMKAIIMLFLCANRERPQRPY